MNTLPMIQGPTSSAPASRRAALRVERHGRTDRGRVRRSNQDRFFIAAVNEARRGDPPGHLFVVADGMGGARGGEYASALAVTAVRESLLAELRGRGAVSGARLIDELRDAICFADARVLDHAAASPELSGMGTTLTVAYCAGRELYVAHVGDSRCYLRRDGALQQVTRDHTFLADMVRRGLISAEDVKHHTLRHIINNVVGARPGLHVEIHRLGLEPGDELLLCSDGLTEMVPDDLIESLLRASPTAEAACHTLIAAANERGGVDNVTAVVARFHAP